MSWQPPAVGRRATWTRTITADDVEAFARFSGDRNPLHFDPAFAAETRVGRLVVQGGLTTALFNALVAMELPGPGSVFLHQEWDYPAPVFIGDTVSAEAEVILTVAVAVVWGVTVVADSAQFSTAVSELAPPGTAGSALAIQTALGFLLTGVTILAVGLIDPGDATGWRIAFGLLALGPLAGIVAMWRLRRRPEASRMANGHR
jgi:acyl dehydratase